MINIATELFESSAKDCQNTLYHFIKNNKWFVGKVYLFTTSNNYPSTASISGIQQIYNNIEIVNMSTHNEFVGSLPDGKITRSNLWRYCLFIESGNILYLSNFSIITTSISNIITEKSTFVSIKYDFIYFNENRSKLLKTATNYQITEFISSQSDSISIDNLLVYSSSIPDKIYARSLNILKAASVIIFDTLTSNINSTTRINSIRLHKLRETVAYLASPTSKIVNRTSHAPKPSIKKSISRPQLNNKIISNRVDPRYVLNSTKLQESNSDFLKVTNANYLESIPNDNYDVACIIAFKDRHTIVQVNIECLNSQTHKPAIVLVASNIEDAEFATNMSALYENVFVVLFKNYPIGGKWQAGVNYARKLNVKGVIILGSDDLLSLNYIKTCFNKIDYGRGSSGTGVDLVGNRSWYIYDTSHNLYYLQYTKQVPIFLGGGRMFSKYFLDSVNWVIFDKDRPVHLDEFGYDSVKEFSNSLFELDASQSIVSIKGSWDMINASHKILSANHRIISNNVTNTKERFFNDLKIPNIDDYLS